MEVKYSDAEYKCHYENETGDCTHHYAGYGCIRDRCDFYGSMMVKLSGDRKGCTYQRDDYCTKFRKFSCPGADTCHATNL